MSYICIVCKKNLTAVRAPGMQCSGPCNNFYHEKCTDLTEKEFDMIEKNHLQFLCKKCKRNQGKSIVIPRSETPSKVTTRTPKILHNEKDDIPKMPDLQEIKEKQKEIIENQKEIKENIQELNKQLASIFSIVDELNNKVNLLQNCQVQTTVPTPAAEPKKTLADIIKENTSSNAIVVLRPKDKTQLGKTTTEEIQKHIDPSTSKITNIKSASGGSVIIACKDTESIEKCSKEMQNKLGDKYLINIPRKRFAQIKIMGLLEELQEDELIDKIEHQNHVLHSNSKIKLISMKKTAKGRIFAIIESDEITHQNIIEKDKIAIGWRECRVFEYVPVARCFKCQKYNHVAKYCTQPEKCGRCAGPHASNECNSNIANCANCIDAKNRFHLDDITVDHCVWQVECAVYQKVIKSEKRKLQFSI